MHSQITPTAAGEPRLAAFTRLLFVLFLFAFGITLAKAQPVFVHPQSHYGGQLVQEMVPYQPEYIYSSAPQDRTPLYLDECPEFCLPGDLYADEPTPSLPSDQRDGLFQKLFFTGTWIPEFDDDSLGITELETGIVFGVPFFRRTAPLLITPRFAVHYLDGPATPDLPPRLYDADITFRHLRKFGSGPWAMDAAVTLGHYSDFESSDADAFRVTGHALAVYETSRTSKWVFGAAYLNRRDLTVVPVVGFIHEPTPDLKYEAILSRPRVAWRLPAGERWAYLAAEYGGGIWSIKRPLSGTQDLLGYNDYRVMLGIERKINGGLNRHVEVGYVFGRELEFAIATPDVRLDDSLFIRGGLTY